MVVIVINSSPYPNLVFSVEENGSRFNGVTGQGDSSQGNNQETGEYQTGQGKNHKKIAESNSELLYIKRENGNQLRCALSYQHTNKTKNVKTKKRNNPKNKNKEHKGIKKYATNKLLDKACRDGSPSRQNLEYQFT